MEYIERKKINIPLTPNFIRIGEGNSVGVIAIQDLTDRELAEIGRIWTNELIEKASKRRKK